MTLHIEPERSHPPPSPRRPHKFTREQYDRMAEGGVFDQGARVELLFGEIVEMSPQNSLHANAIGRLNMLLTRLMADRFVVRVQLPFAAANDHEPEPDLCIVDWPESDDAPHPSGAHLVIEVADTSLEYDRDVKSRIYAQAQVPEYWVVDVNAKIVEVFTQPRGDVYGAKRTVQPGDEVALVGVPDAVVQVARVFHR